MVTETSLVSPVETKQVRKVDLNWICFSVHTRTERYDIVSFQFLVHFSVLPNFWTCFRTDCLIFFPYPCERNPFSVQLFGTDRSGTVKATFHLTTSMRGQRATSKIQRNNYHHGSCGASLTGKTMSVFLIFTQGTHRNVKNR